MIDPFKKLRTKFVSQNSSLDKDRSLIVEYILESAGSVLQATFRQGALILQNFCVTMKIGITVLADRRFLKVFFDRAPHHFVERFVGISGDRALRSALYAMEDGVFADLGHWFDMNVDKFLLRRGLRLYDSARNFIADFFHESCVKRRSLRYRPARLKDCDGLLLLELRRWL